MNNRLKKQSKIYLSILYVLWNLLDYYSQFFNLGTPQDATKLRVKISTDADNVTHLLTDVPCTAPLSPFYGTSGMKDICNEYLNIMLLPKNRELEPFAPANPCSYPDLIDCLYVYQVDLLDNGHYLIDTIYVDNMQAYRKVRADQNIKI